MTSEAGMAGARGTLSIAHVGGIVERSSPFLLGALLPGILAADQGGYWPTAWGWTTIALAWIAAVGLVLRAGRIGGLELVFVGGLTAFTGWTAISIVWTSSTTQSVLSVERMLVYVAAAVAVVAVVRSRSYASLLWGVWAGATADCLYGLATRLLPDRLASTNPIAVDRLSAPVGYWNGLGMLAALAAILALVLAAFGRPVALRPLAAASLPFLMPTLYLTFSRGAWAALAAGAAAVILLSDRRLAMLVTVLALAAPAAAAVWLTERAKNLHLATASLAAATHAGHTVLWELPIAALAAAVASGAILLAGRAVVVPRRLRLAFGSAVAVAGVAGVAVLVAHYGGPGGVLRHARHSFEGVAPAGANLNTRLFSLSSNGRLQEWHVALDEFRAHPVVGGGAGTYAEHWAAGGANQPQVLNAHSVYLETLAELGPFGLALLVAALAAPLVAAVRARRRSLVPVAAATWVAFLVHAAYDWDWQLTGVTLAAIFCAGAVLAAARTDRTPLGDPARRFGLVAVVLAAGLLGFYGLLGNRALAQSGSALAAGNLATAAADARNAHRYAPWSSQPWAELAVARIASGDLAGARVAYRHAVAQDPRDWQLWLGLLGVSHGAERSHALAVLSHLNPGAAAGAAGKGTS